MNPQHYQRESVTLDCAFPVYGWTQTSNAPELSAVATGTTVDAIRGLTPRQREVLAVMMQGKCNKGICRILNLAQPTVKNHVTAILRALNATNRTEAVVKVARCAWALQPEAQWRIHGCFMSDSKQNRRYVDRSQISYMAPGEKIPPLKLALVGAAIVAAAMILIEIVIW
jgi:DNA-binding CsgD family transcriptional regulator